MTTTEPTSRPDAQGSGASAGNRCLRRLKRLLRWFEHGAAVVGLLALLLVVTPLTERLYDALDRQSPLAHADYIICLGGESARIIEAARLLSEGFADRLIVSNHGIFAKAMRQTAIEWGADPQRILVDDRSFKTSDHPRAILEGLGVDPVNDQFIIVTSFTHLARSKACFEKAGYRHLIMREPRWERQARTTDRDWKWRFRVLPDLIYEIAAWAEYAVRGAV